MMELGVSSNSLIINAKGKDIALFVSLTFFFLLN